MDVPPPPDTPVGYMCMVDKVGASMPTKIHRDIEKARAECERLVHNYKAKVFLLEVRKVNFCEPAAVPMKWAFEIKGDEL